MKYLLVFFLSLIPLTSFGESRTEVILNLGICKYKIVQEVLITNTQFYMSILINGVYMLCWIILQHQILCGILM